MGAITSAFDAASTVEEHARQVTAFFAEATHPTLGRPYRDCGYAPMVELLRYLEANGFTSYIASGGDRDFMRPITGDLYGIPPERVIGSSLGLKYKADDDDARALQGELEFFDDGPEKPVRIWSRIGRRPILAAGNSNGDVEMLEFAGRRARRRCGCWSCTTTPSANSTTPQEPRTRWTQAAQDGWTVVSIRTTGRPSSVTNELGPDPVRRPRRRDPIGTTPRRGRRSPSPSTGSGSSPIR